MARGRCTEMALSADIKLLRVGVGDAEEPIAAPLGAGVTVYSGSIALLSNVGYLKNASSPAATDHIAGMITDPTGGTYVKTGPGIVNSGAAGAVWVDCATGTFLLQSATGSDQLSEATAGATVYVVDEQTVGATNGGATRPVAGIQLPIDPTVPTGFYPIQLAKPAS